MRAVLLGWFEGGCEDSADECAQDDYDAALREVDVLVMPTLPCPPCKLFEDPASHGPLERLTRTVGLVGNTAPFNSEYPTLSNTAPFNSMDALCGCDEALRVIVLTGV